MKPVVPSRKNAGCPHNSKGRGKALHPRGGLCMVNLTPGATLEFHRQTEGFTTLRGLRRGVLCVCVTTTPRTCVVLSTQSLSVHLLCAETGLYLPDLRATENMKINPFKRPCNGNVGGRRGTYDFWHANGIGRFTFAHFPAPRARPSSRFAVLGPAAVRRL